MTKPKVYQAGQSLNTLQSRVRDLRFAQQERRQACEVPDVVKSCVGELRIVKGKPFQTGKLFERFQIGVREFCL